MSAYVVEKFVSRRNASGQNPQITVLYLVHDTTDDTTALNALSAAAPLTWDGWFRRRVEVDQLDDTTWEGSATYGPSQAVPGQEGEILYQFETAGGTQHITQSLQTMLGVPASDVSPPSVPAFDGAINVTATDVNGCDIVTPVYQWSETHYFDRDTVDATFRGHLFFLTGTMNDATFGDCEAGEALFLGATGQLRGGPNGPDWEITYRFAASPNANTTNELLNIDPFGIITKRGWDYVWVYYVDNVDGAFARKKPRALYVEQVYREGDWSNLGIPTTPYEP